MAENMRSFIDKLTGFLKSFDNKDKVITDADVKEFFKQLELEKQKSFEDHMKIQRNNY